MNQYDNLEKAMAGALDNLSERVAALEVSAAAPAPSTRFYAVDKSVDDAMEFGETRETDTLARMMRTARPV